MSRLKKFLINPWTIGIIAPMITIVLFKTVDLITGTKILSWCINLAVSVFSAIYYFLNANYEWSLYQLLLLFFSAPALGIFVLWIISKFETAKEEFKPKWFSYTQDSFDNISYKWEWIKGRSGKYQTLNISPHCPKCGCRILNQSCPNCRATYFRGIKEDYEIETLIHHRIETKKMN